MKDVKDMGAWETFKQIPNRIVSLIFNLVSRWGVMLAATFYLVSKDVLNNWYATLAWIVFSILFLFKSEGLEVLERLSKIKDLK